MSETSAYRTIRSPTEHQWRCWKITLQDTRGNERMIWTIQKRLVRGPSWLYAAASFDLRLRKKVYTQLLWLGIKQRYNQELFFFWSVKIETFSFGSICIFPPSYLEKRIKGRCSFDLQFMSARVNSDRLWDESETVWYIINQFKTVVMHLHIKKNVLI